MQRVPVGWMLHLVIAAWAVAARGVGLVDADEVDVSSALAGDDSCSVAGVQDEGGGCALQATQLRASKRSASEEDPRERRSPSLGGNNTTSLLMAEAGEESSVASTYTYNASCYGNAGSSLCEKDPAGGHCVCPQGCMGADGNCYQRRNKLVARNFVLTNAKWPDQKVYVQRMSVFDQLKTTSFSSSYNFGQDKFDLYELPGLFEGRRMFLLASHKWPGYVVSIKATKGTALSLWGTYAVSLQRSHEPWALKDVMLRVCSLGSQGRPGEVKIGTSVPMAGSSIWSYIKEGSYFLYGYWYPERVVVQKVEQGLGANQEIPHPEADTPGPGGFWVPKPPLPHGLLPDC